MIFGTKWMQLSTSRKGTRQEMSQIGFGISFIVISVMMPSVPSEPIIRCSRLYPELVLQTDLPSSMILPSASTTVSART